jgi:hypothetical protein
VETALHQLIVGVEKALDQQEIALGAFLDIEGAFNNIHYDTMCDALVRHGREHTIVRWIRVTLEGRVAVVTLNETSQRVAISRGCPQGGVLSPLLFCLVVNYLITRLNGGGVFDVELHLFSRYARGLAEKNVMSHVTSVRPDVTAVQGAHTRCARIKLRSP